jgi:protein-tyrosine kinase
MDKAMITREAVPSTLTESKVTQLLRSKSEEEYHSLLRSLPWPAVLPATTQLQTVGFTSCLSGEGVSTFAVQTALAAAAIGGHRVLVVDGNLYRPTVHKTFELPDRIGLSEILTDQCTVAEVIKSTRFRDLYAITAGKLDQETATLFGATQRLQYLVEELTERFDLVIVDVSEIGKSSVPFPLLSLLDSVVMVVEYGRVELGMAQQAKQRLDRAGIKLLGSVLNKHRSYIPRFLSGMVS